MNKQPRKQNPLIEKIMDDIEKFIGQKEQLHLSDITIILEKHLKSLSLDTQGGEVKISGSSFVGSKGDEEFYRCNIDCNCLWIGTRMNYCPDCGSKIVWVD